MRTTVALDDELVAEAQDLTGLEEKSSLIREALKALIEERESAQSLGAAWKYGTGPRGARHEDAHRHGHNGGREAIADQVRH